MLKLIPKKQTGGIVGFNDAKKWTQDYISSPMYKQRLQRMNNTEKSITGEFPNGARNNPVATQVQQRLNNLVGVKPEVVKDFPSDAYDQKTIAEFDTMGGGQVLRMRKDVAATPAASATVAHELSHASTNGAPYSTSFDYKYVRPAMIQSSGDRFSNTYSPYIQSPTEVKARLDSIRYQMSKKGLYDAGTQEFDQGALQRLQADKDITNSEDFKSLNSQLPGNRKGESLKWLMNNIAMNRTNTATYAKKGGLIKRK